jgi:hypothetical protein
MNALFGNILVVGKTRPKRNLLMRLRSVFVKHKMPSPLTRVRHLDRLMSLNRCLYVIIGGDDVFDTWIGYHVERQRLMNKYNIKRSDL